MSTPEDAPPGSAPLRNGGWGRYINDTPSSEVLREEIRRINGVLDAVAAGLIPAEDAIALRPRLAELGEIAERRLGEIDADDAAQTGAPVSIRAGCDHDSVVTHLAWDATDCPDCGVAIEQRWVVYEAARGRPGEQVVRAERSRRIRQGRCPGCRREFVFAPPER